MPFVASLQNSWKFRTAIELKRNFALPRDRVSTYSESSEHRRLRPISSTR